MKTERYRPRFFSSLSQSLWNPEFYQQIPKISFGRAFGFLFLLSLLTSLLVLISSWYALNRWNPSVDDALEVYNEYMPDITIGFENGKLNSSSSPHFLSLNIDQDNGLSAGKTLNQGSFAALELDISKTVEGYEFPQEIPYSAALLSDGIVFKDYWGIQQYEYSSLSDQLPNVSYSKSDLALLVKGFFPIILTWIRTALLVGLPLFALVYTFTSTWILALLFLGVGMIILAGRQQKLSASFLIKLAFYCQVPALLVTFITLAFRIFVPYLPLGVFAAYYVMGVLGHDE